MREAPDRAAKASTRQIAEAGEAGGIPEASVG